MSGFVIVQHAFGGDWFYSGEQGAFVPEWYGESAKLLPMFHGHGNYARRAIFKPMRADALVFPSEAAAWAHVASLPDTKFDMRHPVVVTAAPPLELAQLTLFNEADSES